MNSHIPKSRGGLNCSAGPNDPDREAPVGLGLFHVEQTSFHLEPPVVRSTPFFGVKE